MTTRTADLAPDPRGALRPFLLALLVAALVVAAGAGLVSGLRLVERRSLRAAEVALASPSRTDLGIGEHVRTSFGALAVDGADINNGLSPAELGGMSHGISALVSTGRAQVEVVVTLSNTGSRPVVVAADQFRLVTRKAAASAGSAAAVATLAPSGTTLRAAPLPAGADRKSVV